MSLQEWLKNGWLVEHRTSRQEIADLLAMADRDLAQCRVPDLNPDWQLNIAHNAALQLAAAALGAAGYRASREAHHYGADAGAVEGGGRGVNCGTDSGGKSERSEQRSPHPSGEAIRA